MSFWQKLIQRMLPKAWAQDIERESRSWIMTCNTCGTSRSIWEAGGVRYKAASAGKVTLVYCPTCQKLRAMRIEKQ